MKLTTATLLVIGGAFILGACNYTNPPTGAPQTTAAPITATPTPTPAKPETLNDLNGQLNATVDDGGQADLLQLQTESKGL